MDKSDNHVTLYRSVGLQELALIYDSGMKAFPARLPQQPIFYPVLQVEYARQIASDWNIKNGQFAGYVTQFKVEEKYIRRFEKHTVGGSQHQELWIPAEEMDEFNQHIVGHIKVLEAHFANKFKGFVPETFGLQGKDAVEQFTWLANTYIYKRMDFYLELKRNHKAVFLNYPFWQKHDFKNPGLKEKVLQAIRDAWLTSFPKTPLAAPAPQETTPPEQVDPTPVVRPTPKKIMPAKQPDSPRRIKPVHEDIKPIKQTRSPSLPPPVYEDSNSVEQTDSPSFEDSFQEEVTPVNEIISDSLVDPVEEDSTPEEQQTTSPLFVETVEDEDTSAEQPVAPPVANSAPPQPMEESHFAQGIQLGLRGQYHGAIHELSKAVEDDPSHVVAHTSLGVAFHRLGTDDHALDSYETALKTDPIYAEAHYFRANILYSRGSTREAIAGYTMAIGLQPDLIDAHEKPGPQDRLTDYTGAPAEMYWIAKPARRILALNDLIASNPSQVNLFKERAAAYYRLWNYAQAIADYSSFLAVQPKDAGALHARGLAHEQLGQLDRALEDFQQAAAINPQLPSTYINRGVAFGQMGNYRQSIASLTEGIRLAPKNPVGYFNRGMTYFQQGDFNAAIGDFSMAIQLSSSDEDAYYWRGASNEEAGRLQDAIADYRQFLAISKNPRARQEIEHKLSRWNQETIERASSRNVILQNLQEPNPVQPEEFKPDLDLYTLVTALGERARASTWLGNNINCYGESAQELLSFTDQNRSIEGQDFLRIAAGVDQTLEGDFMAFDPGSTAYWILIRAWEGSGFYIETNDPQSKEQLRSHFESAEEVEGASPPYEGLFIRI